MPSLEIRDEKTGIIFSFRGKNQLPLFMIIKEYFDENGEVDFAEVLFEIEGRKCKKKNVKKYLRRRNNMPTEDNGIIPGKVFIQTNENEELKELKTIGISVVESNEDDDK